MVRKSPSEAHDSDTASRVTVGVAQAEALQCRRKGWVRTVQREQAQGSVTKQRSLGKLGSLGNHPARGSSEIKSEGEKSV